MKEFNDFSVSFQEIKLSTPKLNQGIQLVMVISGSLVVETNSRFYTLEEKDLLVINKNELYHMEGSDKNRILTVTLTDQYMEQNYANYFNNRFDCYSKEVDMGREQFVNTIRKLLAETLISYFRKDDGYKIEMQSYMSKILLILIRRFKQKANSKIVDVHHEDSRLSQITQYIEESYNEPITLEETASKFHLSVGYFSRFFKQKMGVGFTRFLMKIRLDHAVKELLYTSHTMEQIALNNGFPSAKSFTQFFKEIYGETPKMYREKYTDRREDIVTVYHHEGEKQNQKSQEIIKKLRLFMEEDVAESFENTEWRSEELTIDVSQSKKYEVERPRHNLSIGELREVMKESVRNQLLMVRKELGLEYVGVRRLIHGSTIIPSVETDEVIPTTSPYYNADFALNFLHSHGFSLFVRVDYQEISEDEENYFKELDLFLKHCLNVHGKNALKSWSFIFFEPYATVVSENEMQRVYLRLYRMLKEIVPSFSVGFFLPFSFKEERTSHHHQWMLNKEVPTDFIGIEANQNEVVNFEDLGDERFTYAAHYIKDKTEKLKQYLRKYNKEKPIHLISWNTLTGNTRFTNGTFFRGALLFKNALDIAREVETLGFWINTEQHEKKGKNRGIHLEGIELFHYFSGKRPAYFSMQFLSRLSGSIIDTGEEYVMTKTDWGYQLVLLNVNNVNPYYSTEEPFLKKLNKDIRVTLLNLEPGEYQVRKRIFDKDNGALYKKWGELNSQYGMDEEVIDYIIQTSVPTLELFDTTFEKDWTFYSYLTLNAIHFFDIRKMNR